MVGSRADRTPDQIARSSAYGCGAGAPPEVPGGGTTFGSRALGAGFSMAGSTSFGWMMPGTKSGGRPWSWRRVGRLGQRRACHERDARDQQANSCADSRHSLLNALMCGPFHGQDCKGRLESNSAGQQRTS